MNSCAASELRGNCGSTPSGHDCYFWIWGELGVGVYLSMYYIDL